MESHFYLQNKGSKQHQIYHFIHCGFKKPIKYYVGKRIDPKYWHKERGKGATFNSLNFYLDSLEAKANNIYLDLKLNGGLTPDNFLFMLKGEKESGKDFTTLYKEFMEESKSTKAYSTVQKYTTALNHLIGFQAHSKSKIIIGNIDLKFYDKFTAYLMDQGLNNNSVGTIIKNLKVFLVHVKKRGVKVKAELKDFKVLAEKKEVLYHSQEEVEILYNLQIPKDLSAYKKVWNEFWKGNKYQEFPLKETLEKAKDIHLLECQTSLRVSDRKRLGIQHIKDSIIRMPAHKTKKPLTIPLTPKAKAILKKYDYKLPDISATRMNEYVKALCLVAGFDYLVEIADYRGGKKNYTKVPKWKLVTNHTAVKTFITHCGEKGISAKVVSEITGKTVKVIIDHYYGTNEKVIEAEMKKAFG